MSDYNKMAEEIKMAEVKKGGIFKNELKFL